MWIFILISACTSVDSPPDAASQTIQQTSAVGSPGGDSTEAPSGDTDAPIVDLDALELDDWELSLLSEVVESVRGGVTLYGEDGFGLCAPNEKRRCETFIGAEHEVLPYGDYIVRAELQAPEHGSEWQVEYVRECTVHPQNGREPVTKSKTWKRGVKYKSTRAYPQRFPNIKSPSPLGREECTVSLYSLRNDDLNRTLITTGRFTIPADGGEAPSYDEYVAKYQISEEPESSEGAQ